MTQDMNFHKKEASVFIPDGAPLGKALDRITHLSIGAHQDDSEIMAFHGILQCYGETGRWFGAVTCTDGAGSPRAGKYATLSDAEMARLRRQEQKKAAVLGDYGVLIQLNYTSAEVKEKERENLCSDLEVVLRRTRPEAVYTHNPIDKHDTHLAAAFAALAALRRLEPREQPRRVLGCEVWRDLDWLEDTDKVALDVSGHENLAMALVGVYDSQVAGGKRYDLATLGRRRANATYFQTHETDRADALWFALDLTPLVRQPELDVEEYVVAFLDRFRRSAVDKIRKYKF